jgi:hypothetical protein
MRLFASIWRSYTEAEIGHIEMVEVTRSLDFDTQLHGGFASASFDITGPQDKTWQRQRVLLGGHVVIFDHLGRRIYEGQIVDVSRVEVGLKIKAMGYYQQADNIFFDMIYPAVESTTNRIPNPSFEVDVTGWTVIFGSLARTTLQARYGSASAQVTLSGSGAKIGVYVGELVAGGNYTFSLFVRNVDTANVPKIQIEELNAGSSIIRTSEKILNGITDGAWVRFELSIEALPDAVNANVWVVASAGTGSFLIDGVQFEAKAYATPYCDGSLGTGHSWSGTAHNSTSSRIYFSATIGQVVSDAVDLIPSWQKVKFSFSEATAFVDSQDFTDNKVKDGLEAVLGFGYKENDFRPVYFVVWEYRVPTLFVEPDNTVYPEWFVPASSISGGAPGVSVSLDNVYNRVYAAYDNQNEGPSKTLPANDLLSQERYGLREGLVQNSNNPEGIVLAQSLRDMALARFKYPRQIYSLDISGLVQHGAGWTDFPYRIRAGDRIVIKNQDVISAHATIMAGEAGQGVIGFVVRTSYSAASNTVKVDIGSDDPVFETLMSRLGLSGGLT